MAQIVKAPQSTNLHLDHGLWYNRRERACYPPQEGDWLLSAGHRAKEKQE
jgi:hypothetical protein